MSCNDMASSGDNMQVPDATAVATQQGELSLLCTSSDCAAHCKIAGCPHVHMCLLPLALLEAI